MHPGVGMETEKSTERRLLEAACLEYGVNSSLVQALVDIEQENERRIRRRGIFQMLRAAIEEYVVGQQGDTE